MTQHQQGWICIFPEQSAVTAISILISLRVYAIDVPHTRGKIAIRGLNNQVIDNG